MPGEANVPGLGHFRMPHLDGISTLSPIAADNIGVGHAEIAVGTGNGKALNAISAVRRQGHDGVVVPTCDSRPQEA